MDETEKDFQKSIKETPPVERPSSAPKRHAKSPILSRPVESDDVATVINALDLRQIWRLIKVHKYFVGICIFAAISCTLIVSFFATPVFKTKLSVSVMPATPYSSVTDAVGGPHLEDTLNNKMSLLKELFRSPDLAELLLRKIEARRDNSLVLLTDHGFKGLLRSFGFIPNQSAREAASRRPRAELLDAATSRLNMTVDYANSAVIIESTAPHPELAQFLANSAADSLLSVNFKVVLKKLTELKVFLQAQSDVMGAKLQKLESELTRFQSDTKIISAIDAEKSVYETMDRQETALAEAHLHLETNKSMIA
jgi:uncharacterized protein involved in exopolysaccharide biosynthesis